MRKVGVHRPRPGMARIRSTVMRRREKRWVRLMVLAGAAALMAAGSTPLEAEPLYQRFRPLTGLPWQTAGTTLEQVMDRLYREPEPAVRYAVLEEYLRAIPLEDFPRAFD